jgi:signal transduction histidine kinase
MSDDLGDDVALVRRALAALDGPEAEAARAAADRVIARARAAVGDEFLATLSHELRGPLSVIIGWIDLLRGDRLAFEERDRALEIVERNARIQARLIEDLVEASRVASGRMQLEVGTVPAVDLVLGVVESMRPPAAAAKITLVAVTDPPFELRGDGLRLGQVVTNIVGNAIRYSPAGSKVELALRSDGDHAVLTVTDTGVGIDQELLPFVFDRFRQGARVRSGGTRGLGLGLYIVRHIVGLHAGTLIAESRGKNQGSRFIVSLPIAGPPMSPGDLI